jgi:hypothetical protein
MFAGGGVTPRLRVVVTIIGFVIFVELVVFVVLKRKGFLYFLIISPVSINDGLFLLPLPRGVNSFIGGMAVDFISDLFFTLPPAWRPDWNIILGSIKFFLFLLRVTVKSRLLRVFIFYF